MSSSVILHCEGCRWRLGQSSYCDDHQDLYTLIQCFGHGNVKLTQTSTRTRCERAEEKTLLPNTIICQEGFLSAAVDRTNGLEMFSTG